MIKKYCKLDEATSQIMKMAAQKYQLSGRRYNRVLKIARTIADLDSSAEIKSAHLTQALQYRSENL
jgi:magnesium chelatase family protein